MHSLSEKKLTRKPNFLYVKKMSQTWDIRSVFSLARAYSPALLIFEDIDSMISKNNRSYFFNEMDGLESNDGLMFIATTNHLDELDPGLKNRPSRFDRKYLFPNPSEKERETYSEQWRQKIKHSKAGKSIKFPEALNANIAKITKDFSFAYLKEAFSATLLSLARATLVDELGSSLPEEPEFLFNGCTPDIDYNADKEFADLPFWKEFKAQVAILREDLKSTGGTLLPGTGSIANHRNMANEYRINELRERLERRGRDHTMLPSAMPYGLPPAFGVRGDPTTERTRVEPHERGVFRDTSFQIDSVRVPGGLGVGGEVDVPSQVGAAPQDGIAGLMHMRALRGTGFA